MNYITLHFRFSDQLTFTAVFGVTLTLKEGNILKMPPIFIILILFNTQKTQDQSLTPFKEITLIIFVI
jgi:hypothetical protein